MPGTDHDRKVCRHRALLALGCVLIVSLAGQSRAFAETGIVFDRTIARLGRVKSVGTIAQPFSFRVVGEHAAQIDEVRPSCGCVKPSLAGRTFAPGESGTISLEIHTTGQELGPHQYRLSLTVRDPKPRTIVLQVELELFSDVRVKPAHVLVYMNGPRELRQTVTISDDRPRPIDVRSLTSSSKWIEPKLVGAVAQGAPSQVQRIELAFAKDFPVGKTEGIVVVSTNDPEYPQFEIPVLVIRSGRVRVSPENLQVALRADARDVKTHTLILQDRENAAIQIERVQCSTPGVRCSWPNVPTRLPKLQVLVDPNEFHAGTVTEGTILVEIREPVPMELVVPLKVQLVDRD